MSRRPTQTEQTLARLAAIAREEPPTAVTEIRAALGHERALVVARAAEAAMQLQLDTLGRDLVAAFERVLRAEDDAELMAADMILNSTTSHTSALEEVAPLLADPEPTVRLAVAEALGVLGGSGAAAVLRLKLESGDSDATVTGACMSSLLRLDAHRYVSVVVGHLRGDNARLAELAALALGESRAPGAFAALRDALDSAARSVTPTILLALALLRSDEATEHLLGVLGRSPAQVAAHAIAALALHKHDAQVADRTRALVAARSERAVRDAFATHFG